MSEPALVAAAPTVIWTAQQQACFNAVTDPAGGNVVLEALAGTGKTTTLVEALYCTTANESVLMCAFNKEIATELERRAPADVTVRTVHALGLRAWSRHVGGNVAVDPRKVGKLITAAGIRERAERQACQSLIGLAKNTMLDHTGGIPALIQRFDRLAAVSGTTFPKGKRMAVLTSCARVLQQCAKPSESIDFDDMLWLPAIHEAKVDSFDRVFVDETQDLNEPQLILVQRACRSRLLACGDRHQAIYGFRGAASGSIDRIVAKWGATCLPLTVTYRCGAAIVAEAQAIVPELEAHESTGRGCVMVRDTADMLRNAAPSDFVISRLNAPLIALTMRWLAKGIPATMRGRDIGEGLAAFVRGSGASNVGEFMRLVTSWEAAEVARLEALDADTSLATDKAECLRALAAGASSVGEIITRLDEIFAAREGSIQLMSTHKAKGLEADRVWLLRSTYCEDPNDAAEQDKNLLYVAITRAKKELNYVQ